MALVVEMGSGLANANTYASLAYADNYFAGHPFYADNWDELNSTQKEALLISATQFLDNYYIWYGYRATTTQALEWPRTGVRDVYGLVLPPNAIPPRLVQATCEQAFYLTKGDRSVEAVAPPDLDKLKIDVIELDFSSSTSGVNTQPIPSTVRNLLRGLGDYAVGMRVRRVVVG